LQGSIPDFHRQDIQRPEEFPGVDRGKNPQDVALMLGFLAEQVSFAFREVGGGHG
jgi:hypothetical protein